MSSISVIRDTSIAIHERKKHMTTSIASVLLTSFAVLLSHSALAESLEDYLKRGLLNDITLKMYHPDGKYMLLIGNKEMVLNRSQVMQASEQGKAMGTRVELLDFKILNKYETDNIVSAVVKAKFRQSVGAAQVTGETVSHELLLKKNGSYVSVFSIGRQ